MVRVCSVLNCKSKSTSFFSFPRTPTRREKWKRNINRSDLSITKKTLVCSDHFEPELVLKSETFHTSNGNVVDIPRMRPKLAPGACPTPLSENIYSKNLPVKRKNPAERENEIRQRELKKIKEDRLAALEADKIKSFNILTNELPYKNITPFTAVFRESYIVFFRLDDDNFHSLPAAKVFFKVCDNLDVNVFIDNKKVATSKYREFLGEELKCNQWSRLDNLIKFLGSYTCNAVINQIDLFTEHISEIIENENDLEEDVQAKLKFLTEQLSLINKAVPRYSTVMLKFAAALYYAFPGAYKTLRDTKYLTLPHPRYLRKILGKCGINTPGLTASNIAFMKEKFKLLETDDKIVSLLFDEIYVNASVKYKAGRIVGMAEESQNTTDCTAGTLQAFMFSSLKSKNKDIAALVPVRKLDGEILTKLTREVLKVLHEVGYTVLNLIADDNSVNKKMYENLCGGTLKQWIPHPLDESKRLYLLFDTVHLFKNIRNNWINSPSQVFKIPPVSDFNAFIQEFQATSKSTRKDSIPSAPPGTSIPCGSYENQTPKLVACDPSIPSTSSSANKENVPPSLSETVDLTYLENNWLLENEGELDIDLAAEFETDPFFDHINISSATEEVHFTEAKFSDIKALFYAETKLILKLAHKLTRKSVFPSKIERQNVSLVINVFNDLTILALETLRKDGSMDVSEGTIILLCWIVRWWKVVNVKNSFKGTRLNDKWCEPICGPNDEKLKFLCEFEIFLKKWQDLGADVKLKGKLTLQTFTALSHTVGAHISLCNYVFETYGWDSILLGKLMTDLIEGRFGGYRRLSGCNYHVSVEQVIESERKLKMLGVLKLKAASVGEFSINTFCDKVQSASEDEKNENLDFFKDAVYEKENVPVPLNSKRILIILSSYTATKVIQTFVREGRPLCENCVEVLISNELLDIERPEEVYQYLSGVDRGGLNKPSAFSYDLCINIYKLFETLVSSTYESKFLKLKNHRKAIITLGLRMCDVALENSQAVCHACETCVEKVINIYLRTMSNILLNNYTRKVNEQNDARRIAVKMNKQNILKERNNNNNDVKNVGKEKDKDARKVLKLSSNENF